LRDFRREGSYTYMKNFPLYRVTPPVERKKGLNWLYPETLGLILYHFIHVPEQRLIRKAKSII
jgi:hypothetical protein